MSINKRQFTLLQAMGITVWQRRELSNHSSPLAVPDNKVLSSEQVNVSTDENTTQTSSAEKQKPPLHSVIVIDLTSLLKQPLFKDIISCLGASSADISIEHNQIDLGIINWQFTSNDSIEFDHNCLKTPHLTIIANSPTLKKSLWQTIGHLSSS